MVVAIMADLTEHLTEHLMVVTVVHMVHPMEAAIMVDLTGRRISNSQIIKWP